MMKRLAFTLALTLSFAACATPQTKTEVAPAQEAPQQASPRDEPQLPQLDIQVVIAQQDKVMSRPRILTLSKQPFEVTIGSQDEQGEQAYTLRLNGTSDQLDDQVALQYTFTLETPEGSEVIATKQTQTPSGQAITEQVSTSKGDFTFTITPTLMTR